MFPSDQVAKIQDCKHMSGLVHDSSSCKGLS